MWNIFVISYFVLHSLCLIILLFNWRRIKFNKKVDEYNDFISVIIACRNEEENITKIIESINLQDYPVKNFEVIIVDDHSTDKTPLLVAEFLDKTSFSLKLISLTGTTGKKSAISEGINNSQGEIIIITDADCKRKNGWLRSMLNKHKSGNNDLSFGLVKFWESSSFFSKIVSIEQTSLVGAGAALWRLGVPVMSNGANMIFSKRAFQQVGGYSGNLHIPSGDDEFLLSKFRAHNLKIGFVDDIDTVIETAAPSGIVELLNQRKRWAGKWKASLSLSLKLVAIVVFFLQIFWLVSLIAFFAGKVELAYFLLGMLLKAFFDFIFLKDISARLNKELHLLPFFFLEVVYPLYVIFFALISNFGAYSWKGRKYSQFINSLIETFWIS